MEGIQYIELMEISKDYCNLFRELYRIRRFNEEEINNFYNEIKRKLIDTKICSPEKILDEIICASKYNNGSYKSYWFIFEKILNDYHISDELNSEVFGINYHNQCQKYSLEIHEPGSIYRAIMEDDNKSFIAIIESDGSYENKLL
ncbi:hypothetical protein TVAG_348370 [Trichomonas vaginalis G3]|uniref:Uncharacterized protein n=1 Tax=Trichomonas vaginalis (strain ATCC PRA-98 / G3) TaxID=412133 RepID=A2DSX8_TRIV3|nr:proteasome regulatory particle assembly [Trichomonas vaginalis G3]EAY16527.1 hypothetical protein TVAG_348370 [Trichomonas vaginalis G3]KAI5493570.1 proteasome regulatory particle assembly [Trichomonas vaginalis G3]|eukprot:XP_001328750.1 hypothetical protein [Trichomonas vaginalis G3]